MFQFQLKQALFDRLKKATQSCKGHRKGAGLTRREKDYAVHTVLYRICNQLNEFDKESEGNDADIFLTMMKHLINDIGMGPTIGDAALYEIKWKEYNNIRCFCG